MLPELCLRDIGVLPEMQLFEFLILCIALRLNDGGDIKAFELHAVIKKVRDKPLPDIRRKCLQALINFKDVDGIVWAM